MAFTSMFKGKNNAVWKLETMPKNFTISWEKSIAVWRDCKRTANERIKLLVEVVSFSGQKEEADSAQEKLGRLYADAVDPYVQLDRQT